VRTGRRPGAVFYTNGICRGAVRYSADPDASRQRVDSLLFKVRVVSSTLRERQKAAFRMRAGQSS